jgi:hypothetical protein
MSRGKQFALLLGGLLLVALVGFLAYRSRPQPPPSYPPGPDAGLAWLPANAAAVGAVDLVSVRQQPWFLDTLRHATEGVTEDADYRAFVEAIGFDYSRDLDFLWLAGFAEDRRAVLAGVAEGRFDAAKIIAYARSPGAAPSRYQNFSTYEWRQASAPGQPERRFAFAFLESSRLAFAADANHLNAVIDCWLGRRPNIVSDERRRAGLARLTAGQHAWVTVDPARWSAAPALGQSDPTAVIVQGFVGLRVNERQAELRAEARCREPQACERLRDNLRIMTLAGRVALSRDRSEAARALAEALGSVSLELSDRTVEARLTLAPETLAALLRAAPGAVPRP